MFPLNLGGNVFDWTADEQQSFAVLDACAAAGGDFVDTADAYSVWAPGNPGGVSEEIIGRWRAARGNRDEIVPATKVGWHPEAKGPAAGTLRAAAEASPRRLATDHLDPFSTHFDDPSVPVEEFLGELDALAREGKVRHIAASDITAERLEEALPASDRAGLARYVAIQPHDNLVSRDTYEGPPAETAARHGLVALPCFSPAAGFLTGEYRPGVEVDSPRSDGAMRHLDSNRGRSVPAALDKVAEQRGTSVTAVALAWLRAQPTVVAPVVSARNPQQLSTLLASVPLALDEDEVAVLTAASA
ncbi:aryl-alcohol dehydrogenase-like predicted oxidoreductase [Actinoalloteichus hoggarensis]|uniref:General stress protein 69 n=1 Tax=Actinoalloteichus hoggarensis TaxID=1470176 RepID=A0A221W815_9PSEU|nr:aldo/keto reductase [Actinoalloteichus hoggarensis]ASO21786.1 General stress protein 69 [Actinoalloteichus hoggarensis]MBB5922383.1 aryl-alcohol dehydrogenase-like predicted oxidoreductase [Actinoalloteichus hoggarensis]